MLIVRNKISFLFQVVTFLVSFMVLARYSDLIIRVQLSHTLFHLSLVYFPLLTFREFFVKEESAAKDLHAS